MDINFYKLQILRNDFILSDIRTDKLIDLSILSDIAVKICDRHIGVGANGIIFITGTEDSRTVLFTFAPDGTYFDFLIDSTLAAARYIFDTISTDKSKIRIKNNNKDFTLDVIDSTNFRIQIGTPLFSTKDSESLIFNNYSYRYTKVNMGKTGIVFFPENRPRDFLKSMHNEILKSETLKESQPIFVKTLSPDIIEIITWKNKLNTDNSLNAAIGVVASILNGYENSILVNFYNSKAFVEWDQDKNNVFLTSTPEYIFTGQYYYDDDSNS